MIRKKLLALIILFMAALLGFVKWGRWLKYFDWNCFFMKFHWHSVKSFFECHLLTIGAKSFVYSIGSRIITEESFALGLQDGCNRTIVKPDICIGFHDILYQNTLMNIKIFSFLIYNLHVHKFLLIGLSVLTVAEVRIAYYWSSCYESFQYKSFF